MQLGDTCNQWSQSGNREVTDTHTAGIFYTGNGMFFRCDPLNYVSQFNENFPYPVWKYLPYKSR